MEGHEARRGNRRAGLLRPLAVRDFRLVWLAQVGSEVGDWAARLALSALVLERTGSPLLAGLVTTASVLPWVGLGQVLATLGDRFPRRTVLIVSDLVRAAAFAAMLAPIGVEVTLALAFLAGLAAPPFQAAKAALLPEILPDDRYGDGLALAQVTRNVALAAGYLTGGGLVAAVSASGALLVNAATFLASALILTGLRGGRVHRGRRRAARQLRAAVDTLRGDPVLFRAAALVTVTALSAMPAEALVVVYARDVLGADAALAGLLAAAVPAGTVLGAVAVRRHGDHGRVLRGAAWLAAAGTMLAVPGFAAGAPFPFAIVPFLGIGVIFAVVVPANVVAGTRIPDDRRAAVFALLQGSLMAALAIGAAGGGMLAGAVGVGRACALALLPGAAYAAFTLIRKPAKSREPIGPARRSYS